MAIWRGRRPPSAALNVTPLVDVVLVLLIVFMVTAPLAERELPLRVPERAGAAVPVGPDRVAPDETVLKVRRDGRVLLDGRDLSLDDAERELRAAFAGRPSRVLFFDAEDAVRYELAVAALDRARAAGVEVVGVLTESVESRRTPE